MDINKAKQQVKDTIEAYLATDEKGRPLLDVSRQRPIFLVGAPGIGKTAIMSQIAAELGIGLVSYSMTHHTRQSALGLPYIVKESYGDFEYEASEYTMSEIVASVYDYMREHKVERGILFLDEINCVSETLYPSMLQFLQFKTFGRHQIPAGWIVVTAGNPPEYNKSVHDFDIVTLDRLKRIVVEPSFDAWKAYAAEKETHPAITTFLSIKKDRFYVVEATLDGKSFVTARGWDDLSEIISIFEALDKTVDYDLIIQYVQNEKIAREFATYYELFNKYRDDYRIDDILAGADDVSAVIERAQGAEFDERLSLIGLMLDSLCGSMRAINQKTALLVELRDVLRDAKACVVDSGANAAADLKSRARTLQSQLEMQVAAGTITKAKRERMEQVVAELACMARVAESGGFSAVEKAFAVLVGEISPIMQAIESQLANAFAFIEDAFGDKQEMLVFVTELTSRTDSARYIAQYGSDSYYRHNENMILSERQRELRHRVEELDL